MRQFRKLLAVALASGALVAGSVPAQAAATEDTPQADQSFCSLIPRICEALCIKNPEDARCRK